MSEDEKKYPTESGFYHALWKSGKKRRAYFTVVTQEKGERKSRGKWGTKKPGDLNYIPLIDPIEWYENE